MPLSRVLSLILHSLVPYRTQILVSLVLIFTHTLFGFSLIFLTSHFSLGQIPVFLILLFSLHHLFSVFDDWILTGISSRWISGTRRKCLRDFLENTEKSHNNSLIDWNELQMEIHWIGESIFSLLRSTLRKIFQILVFSIALIWLSPILFLFCGVLFLVVFLLGLLLGKRINRLQEKVIADQASCANFEFEAARAMPLVRAFRRGSQFSALHEKFLHKFTKNSIQLSRMRMIFHPAQILLFLATLMVVYSAGSALVADQKLSQSAFFSFLAGLSLLHAPLSGLSQDLSFFVSTRHMKFMEIILLDLPDPPIAGRASPVQNIIIENVSFSYSPESSNILKDFSFSFKAGSLTGVSGSNGSGKTTLALLLAGVLRPTSGRIFFDAEPFPSCPVGLVDQNGTVFTLGVTENLFIESDSVPVEHPLHRSKFLHFLPDTTDDLCLSPETLSSGQKKCISLARAFFSNPGILIIDEPENALDSHMQEVLQSEIQKWKQENSIIILFSHSNAFLSICDQTIQIPDTCEATEDSPCFT